VELVEAAGVEVVELEVPVELDGELELGVVLVVGVPAEPVMLPRLDLSTWRKEDNESPERCP